MSMRLALLLLLVASASVPVSHAQPTSPNAMRSVYSASAYYRYATPEDLTIRVNVWGALRFPGYYEVPRGTTLSTLMSLTGGPNYTDRRRGDERITLLRLTRGTQVLLAQETINDVFVPQEEIVLQEGDVFTVETVIKPRSSWRDYAPVASAAASVLSALVVLLVNVGR